MDLFMGALFLTRKESIGFLPYRYRHQYKTPLFLQSSMDILCYEG